MAAGHEAIPLVYIETPLRFSRRSRKLSYLSTNLILFGFMRHSELENGYVTFGLGPSMTLVTMNGPARLR